MGNEKEPTAAGNGEEASASQRLTPTVGLRPPEGNPSCSSALTTHSGDIKSPNGVIQVEGGRALTRELGDLIQTLIVTSWVTLGPPRFPRYPFWGSWAPHLSVCLR